MTKEKKLKFIAIFLLVISFNLLVLSAIYSNLEKEVVNYRYSDVAEYDDVKEAINFINSFPIQFNITNEYFSNFDNLEQQTREMIIMSYVIKNKYRTYSCEGTGTICIKKEDLQDEALLEKFNTKTEFISDNIKIYIDDYGVYTVTTSKELDYYKVSLDDDNKNYRKYSKFSHYKEKDGVYSFYFYEGYYKGNCRYGEKLELYNFMDGKVIYSGNCNAYNEFTIAPDEDITKLQLYKYELKKDVNGKYYLYGYNPVN